MSSYDKMSIPRLFYKKCKSRLVILLICCVLFYIKLNNHIGSSTSNGGMIGNQASIKIDTTVKNQSPSFSKTIFRNFFEYFKNSANLDVNDMADKPSQKHSNEMKDPLVEVILRPEQPIRVNRSLLERYRAKMVTAGNFSKFSATVRYNVSLCPIIPPGLLGQVNLTLTPFSYQEIAYTYPNLQPGGHWYPNSCKARDRVAIIIPYKNRDPHLRVLLYRLHAMLPTQQLDYAIFVIEPLLIGNETFNRGKLMNIGILEAIRRYDFDCMVFHDVDHIPEDDRNIYYCPASPRHNAVSVDKDSYVLRYNRYFGGVSTMTFEHLDRINGYSNDFWGWGGEDDEALIRVEHLGYNLTRLAKYISHYKAMNHTKEQVNPINPCRWRLKDAGTKRYLRDGLRSTNYTLLHVTYYPTHTWILVDLLEKQFRAKLAKEKLICDG